jgi:hypothetical protein
VRSGAAQSDNSGFGKGRHHSVAKQRDLVSERHLAQGKIIRVYMDVPQSGHQIRAVQVDFCSISNSKIVAVGTNLADSATFDQY